MGHSLDRLKALDNLPSLDDQLDEIERLCTHPSRAEMAAKWLYGRMQKDATFQANGGAWEVLTKTLRLLSPEAVANILGGSHVLKACQAALTASDSDGALTSYVCQLLSVLLGMKDALGGAALRAALSLSASDAAEFVGTLLRSSLPPRDSVTVAADSETITFALAIWVLRKRSNDDNQAFSEHCLVPCALLLKATDSEALATKRPRGAEDKPSRVKAAVESQLARHIFLPARSAFFKARASTTSKHIGSQRPAFAIESLLRPLSGSRGKEQPLDVSAALPPLLEIALRSAPMPSPTQRVHEKPWIEALYRALYELGRDDSGDIIDDQALCDMLDVLSKRSRNLPASTLTDIVQKDAGLDAAATGHVKWRLVAAAVNVDAAIFKDTASARALFSAITSATIKMGEDANADMEHVQSLRHVLRDRIAVPVLTTFARLNDSAVALELCNEQLRKDLHGTFWSVWNELDGPIQTLLDQTLSPERIADVCRKYCNIVIEYVSQRTVDGIEDLSAAIVILNGLLANLSSEEVLNKVEPDLNYTFKALMELHDVRVGPGSIPALRERKCWALQTNILNLCFPGWSAWETDAAILVEKFETILPRPVLDRAVDLSAVVHPGEYGSVHDPQSASDAKCFLVDVCTRMLAYKGLVAEDALKRYADLLDAMARQCEQDAAARQLCCDAFATSPVTLNHLDDSIRQQLLRAYVAAAAEASQKAQRTSDLAVLVAIGSSAASSQPSPTLVNDLIEAILASLTAVSGAADDLSHLMEVADCILSGIPAKSIARSQREKLLDCLCGPNPDETPLPAVLMAPRLPMVLRLLEQPNPTARVCLDARLVAEMAETLDQCQATTSEADSVSASSFEQLVTIILQQCIRTKDQERSKKMLVDLSTETSETITGKQVIGGQHGHRRAMVKACFRELEAGVVSDLKSQLPHCSASTVKDLLSGIAAVVEHGLADPAGDGLGALDLLLAISPALFASSDFEAVPLLTNVAEFLEERLDSPPESLSDDAEDGLFESLFARDMVRCYQILGRFAKASDVDLASFADGLLHLPLTVQEHAAVLTTFREMLNHLGMQRVALARKLLDVGLSTPPSTMDLVQLSVGSLEKSDFDAGAGQLPTVILSDVLLVATWDRDLMTSRRALHCVMDILKTKLFMVNQYNVELTLEALHQLVQRDGAGKHILYLDVCSTLSTLLLHHRSRLHGRAHMMAKLLQALLSSLFEPLHGWDKATARRPPTQKHAQALSRLLKLFCEPPQQRSELGLVDESRKEQAHVGTFVQHVLHHYCVQVLHGTLGEGMKDALTPGLRVMIEAMEMNGAEGGKALSAAMNNSERAVLRGLFEDWRRFGKWRGG